MTISIPITADQIQRLDLSAADAILAPFLQDLAAREQTLQFQLQLVQDADDPRELSEIPEVRLWFICLDAKYPWLPFLLDWKAGELVRYAAMLVPHQFHPRDGLQYNPEALEIWVMHKVFVLLNWFQQQGLSGRSRLQAMTQLLGYEIEDDFFTMLGF